MRIEKKVWPEYYERILSGEKTFEIRLNDFDCESGDILVLREWDPTDETYTGRSLEKEVTYVSSTKNLTFWSEEEIEKHGYKIIAFR